MKGMITKISGAMVALLAPVVVFAVDTSTVVGVQSASTNSGTGTLLGVVHTIYNIVALGVPVLLTLAIVFFLWKLSQYMLNEGQEKEEARNQMIWGIVAIAVMVSIWGLVGIVQSTVTGASNNQAQTIQLPQ